MAAGTPAFHFEHAGSHKPLAWPKYKLKECWTLVLCLLALRGRSGPVILHNWRGGSAMKFTRAFHEGVARRADDRLAAAPLVDPFACGAGLRGLALLLAALLALLPVAAILAVTRRGLPRAIDPLVVYCDGHLSGFVLVLAVQAQGSLTMTLHHGLYRLDDRGSLMGIRNFVADRICLWDAPTEQMFRDAGADPARLLRVGAYGFGGQDTADAVKPDRILFCPPYDVARFAVFEALEPRLPENSESLWSLHPMLRADHPHLTQAAMASVSPRPALAICGDSGVLMDALAREIPIITIADRPLAQTHLGLDEARALTPEALAALMVRARAALDADRARFGFDPLPQETG